MQSLRLIQTDDPVLSRVQENVRAALASIGSSPLTLPSLSVSGNVAIAGNLTVTGTSTLTGAVTMGGTLAVAGAVTITGVLTLSAVPKFGGTNSTGASIPAPGANCPAITVTAPYTWVKFISADGSTCYFAGYK